MRHCGWGKVNAPCRVSPPHAPCRAKLRTRKHDTARALTTRCCAIAQHRTRAPIRVLLATRRITAELSRLRHHQVHYPILTQVAINSPYPRYHHPHTASYTAPRPCGAQVTVPYQPHKQVGSNEELGGVVEGALSPYPTAPFPFPAPVRWVGRIPSAHCALTIHSHVSARHLTVCVSGGGAGVDKTSRAEFRLGVEKARKCRRIPTVRCTLCWLAFCCARLYLLLRADARS